MSIQVIKKNQQAAGQFNGGEILENKPIGFPREGGHLRPYSNLFYWSHAWSDQGSTIGLHPHQGFEILSFVLEGSIEHFDTGDNEWKTLNAGDAQIIRAGSGISHSEKLNAGAHMFQIWLDPDLGKTLDQKATYSDYKNEEFPLEERDGIRVKTYHGANAPLQMDTKGVEIKEYFISGNQFKIDLEKDSVHSFYVVKGAIEIDGKKVESDDFFKVESQNELLLKSEPNTVLFSVSQPSKLAYRTYAERIL